MLYRFYEGVEIKRKGKGEKKLWLRHLIGNRNLVGTQIIGAGHTIMDLGNFYRGMMTFLPGNNRRKLGKSARVDGGEKKAASQNEKRNKAPIPRRSKSLLRPKRALSSWDRLWKSCLSLLLRVAKNTPSTRRINSTVHEVEPIRQAVEYRR